MSDGIVKDKVESVEPSALPERKEASSGGEIQVEVPYMDYQGSNGHPFVADHYSLGDTWNDPAGGFPNEVVTIENYIKDQINQGEIANNLADVKNLLKGLERMTNVSKESRSLIKVETLAAYIEFLLKTDKLRSNLRRYGSKQA